MKTKDIRQAVSRDLSMAATGCFCVVYAHNLGNSPTLQINHLCEKLLRYHKKDDITLSIFKMLLMVRCNDYAQLLVDGDTCVVVEDNGMSTAWFDANNQVPGISGYLICPNVNRHLP